MSSAWCGEEIRKFSMEGEIPMDNQHQLLSSDVIQMLVSSVTNSGNDKLSELEAERLLNAIARVQSGVPTGVQNPNGR
jgi:hypothetical protein